jgi:hypothetical protein
MVKVTALTNIYSLKIESAALTSKVKVLPTNYRKLDSNCNLCDVTYQELGGHQG